MRVLSEADPAETRRSSAGRSGTWHGVRPGYLADMKATIFAALVGAALGAGCGGKPKESAPSATNAASGNPITAPVDYVGAVGQAQKQAAKVVDLVQVQQAIRQFQAAEDRYPKTLEELVREGYLPALPKLPAGLQLEYNPATGQARAAPVRQTPKP